MTVEQAYQILYGGALIVLILLIGAMVIRSIIGPRSTDRIMSVNMLGTMTICSIAVLSVLLDEGYLADVALIYAMISFVAVLMMASMFVPSGPKAPRLDEEPAVQKPDEEPAAQGPGSYAAQGPGSCAARGPGSYTSQGPESHAAQESGSQNTERRDVKPASGGKK